MQKLTGDEVFFDALDDILSMDIEQGIMWFVHGVLIYYCDH